MRILGIVAEYDPFHRGHETHLRRARSAVDPDETLIVMSGCFKQRGDPALFAPHDRAKCALLSGADAVFALPVLWTLRDAEHYALGAISALSRLGCTHMAFGAEETDVSLLERTAGLLESPDSVFEQTLRSRLDEGEGYPSALDHALEASLPEARGLLTGPNNILAVNYLRVIRRLGLSLVPVVIPRSGTDKDLSVDPASPSASAVRRALLRGNWDSGLSALPAFAAPVIRRAFSDLRISRSDVWDALLVSRLRAMSDAEYHALPDLSEGLENRLKKAASRLATRNAILDAVSCKRYPSARIGRLCACVLLGVTAETLSSVALPDELLLLGIRRDSAHTSRWKDLDLSVLSSLRDAKDPLRHETDLKAWKLWAQSAGLPDTLPFSEKIVAL